MITVVILRRILLLNDLMAKLCSCRTFFYKKKRASTKRFVQLFNNNNQGC